MAAGNNIAKHELFRAAWKLYDPHDGYGYRRARDVRPERRSGDSIDNLPGELQRVIAVVRNRLLLAHRVISRIL